MLSSLPARYGARIDPVRLKLLSTTGRTRLSGLVVPDDASLDSQVLHNRCAFEVIARECDHAAWALGAGLRSNLESEPHACRPGGEREHRANSRQRSDSVPHA